jgi:hypothetical protein
MANAKGFGGMAQVVMCFPSKHEAEHKNPVLPKNIHWFSSAM